MSSDVVVLIAYRALPGKEEDAKGAIGGLVRTVLRTEPDCRGITILHNAADPGHILLVEQWSSRESYLGPHMQTPHIKAWIAEAPAVVSGPPEITFWRAEP
jgi:quinol monooxygenase YgiN